MAMTARGAEKERSGRSPRPGWYMAHGQEGVRPRTKKVWSTWEYGFACDRQRKYRSGVRLPFVFLFSLSLSLPLSLSSLQGASGPTRFEAYREGMKVPCRIRVDSSQRRQIGQESQVRGGHIASLRSLPSEEGHSLPHFWLPLSFSLSLVSLLFSLALGLLSSTSQQKTHYPDGYVEVGKGRSAGDE